MKGFTAKYKVRTTNPADPTEVATLTIKSDLATVEIEGMDTVWFRIHAFNKHFAFKSEKVGLAILDFAKECDHYGTRRVFEKSIWGRFSQKARLAWCIFRDHAWHAEDEGDAESGPKPPAVHCLRCGCIDTEIGTDIVDVVVRELDYGDVKQGHLVMLHPAEEDDSIWPKFPWDVEEED